MIIGIDTSRCLRAEPTGTEHYSRQIISHLLATPHSSRFAFRLYVPSMPAADTIAQNCTETGSFISPRHYSRKNVTFRVLAGQRLWTHRVLAWEVSRRAPDVLFVPAHVVPFLPPALLPPTIVTVHDLGYRYFPQAHTPVQRFYLELSTRWNAAAAQKVIAISQQTATDLQRFYRVPEPKISVVHEAPVLWQAGEHQDNASTPVASGENTTTHLPRTTAMYARPFALYVGTIQPRKNLLRLIEGFERLVHQQSIRWDLVLVGRWGWLSDEYETIVAAKGLTNRIHFPGYLTAAAVATLMQRALFFVFPSLFEGFGLPVLEAQTTGVPVMCANNSALPEIAGDAALLVDPFDVDAMAAAMLRLSRDEDLRQELINKGYENVKRFSWEKAATETLALLEEVAAKG